MSKRRSNPLPSFRPSVAVLLGADVGGSHTAVAVARADGEILARADGPGGAMKLGGGAASAAILAEAARRAADGAGVALPADVLVVGAAGAGRAAEQAELANALQALDLARRVRVVGDIELALQAAFGSGPGIVLNAGTGSIAFARDADGQVHRSGGYGWQMGDEGGGYWLGRRALAAVARAHDGREEGSTLLARFLAALGFAGLDDLVAWAATAVPGQVAALAPHVLSAAGDGEAVAQRIVAEAARELAGLAQALERWFPGDAPIPLALTGGLLRADSRLAAELRAALGAAMPRARLATGQVDGALGAVRLATELWRAEGTSGAARP